jgi:hypothetical protein
VIVDECGSDREALLLRNVFLEYSSNRTYGKYAKKSFPLKPVSQFKASMAIQDLAWNRHLMWWGFTR